MNIKILFELRKFIKNLDKSVQVQILLYLDLLEENGQSLRMPYSKSLGKGLFELRIISKVQIRIFYCFHKDTIYLLDIVTKKTQKLSPDEITYARKIKRQVESL